ncbi:hypothetical protein RF11_14781 [Thelohanellus kitauei]|uniref:Uncharacterized protein n=1 Tax=Thelohanellus kitauei TaxID=669202 RepID=A0A0C2MQK3_THEKT|nr:hypothetical protein RF11_14781 [Thelohanellus kitauei]
MRGSNAQHMFLVYAPQGYHHYPPLVSYGTMGFSQKISSVNDVPQKWQNTKDRISLTWHNFGEFETSTHKVYMGGGYVGITSNRYRAISVPFENDIGKKTKFLSWVEL